MSQFVQDLIDIISISPPQDIENFSAMSLARAYLSFGTPRAAQFHLSSSRLTAATPALDRSSERRAPSFAGPDGQKWTLCCREVKKCKQHGAFV